jgi:plastocyanin
MTERDPSLKMSLAPRAPRSALLIASIALLALLLAACAEDAPPAAPGPDNGAPPADGTIAVSSDNLAFDTDRIVAPAGEPITIEFTNHENQPHNIAVYTDSSKSEELFRGEIITGPDASVTYEIDALEPGEYYFDCTVHPDMNGSFVVEG